MRKKYNFNLKEIGKRLKDVRSSLGLTIERMHEITGFSRSLISEAENGIKKPSAIYLFELLYRFNANINYVFSGKGEMFLPTAVGDSDGPVEIEDDLSEMFYLIEHVDMVKYGMLSHFINYKTLNKNTINKLLEEKKKKFRV